MAWTIDAAHSHIGFSVRHMVVSTVRGQFNAVRGTLELNEANPSASWVEAEVDTASIDTHDANRDAHLRSAEFFDAEKFPKITFKSTKVEGDSGDFKVTGDLTIHGVTKPVTFEVEYSGFVKDPYGLNRAGLSAQTKINRKDFGLGWNPLLETGGAVVSDEVKLNLEFEATQQPA
ncbi:YceI family protein [Dictyobacter aurantiacus]|uniref:Polyisoprenoid-binding protein n=1 Tax=Dictyobacter aurantiacus TaxID=1936993 RepID=A0A401ZES0_9CHLR|nr:YceI family protein [Dictyobacter aurantiacus]GCE05367.1 polyisoprenoid-binding protein [Dictyobacter aurantiacus]